MVVVNFIIYTVIYVYEDGGNKMSNLKQLINGFKTKRRSWFIFACCLAAGATLFFYQDLVFAGGQDLTKIAERVTEQIKSVTSLLVVVAYVAGVGFALAGVMQFKAHKDNPTQVPLSKPIVYLSVGAFLLFLPTVLKSAGETIFGSEKTAGESGKVDLK